MSSTSERTYNVLFLCTGNSARSIIAEALLNYLGQGRFHAYSAGSHPAGKVNPLAIEMVRELAVDITELRSKSWNEFASTESPRLDFVFTVCDNAAGEVCPHWPGQPMTAHWGIEDPAAVAGSESAKRRAFELATMRLRRRIDLFLSLPLNAIDALALQSQLNEIGRTP
jgi:protein-tyrosine-phosphatase